MATTRRLLAVLLCLLFAFALAQEPTVRVLLSKVQGPVTVTVPEGHRGYVDGILRFETSLPLSWPLRAQEGRLWLDGTVLGRSLTLEPAGGLVSWQGRPYRGALSFVAQDATLLVINALGLEDYLRGVVPSEIPASWPLEALKAQAVAARTYTLTSLDPASDYDICATVDCQVYEGAAAENPRSDQAVAGTRALVLTYRGGFAKTYYHADSGGYVASSAEVWDQALPYLPARSDVTGRTPHGYWQKRLDPQAVAASLQALGLGVGPVRALRVLAYSESGRAERAVVAGQRGEVALEGALLQSLLRGWGLKSTRFTMRGELLAEGSGWGHGVGMSQYGARNLALQGHGFDRILAFYYPTTVLQALPYPQSAEHPVANVEFLTSYE